MGTVARPTKAGGTQQYATEVAAGFTFAQAAEVDEDMDTLYTLVNGNIDTNNISSINGSKITPGTLPAAQITPGSITDAQISNTANINGTKLLNNSVPGAKLANLDVPTTKLAVNASSPQLAQGLVQDGLSFNVTETTVVTATITTRGGRVRITGCWSASCTTAGVGATGSVILRLKRDGTTIIALDQQLVSSTGTFLAHWPLPMPTFVDTPAAGAHTYLITAQSSGPGFQVFTPASPFGTGVMQLEEAA